MRVRAHIHLARAYLAEGNYQRARVPIEKALEVDDRSVEAHVLQAIVYQRDDEIKLAEKHYKLALRYGSDNAQALNNYGSFLFAQGRAKAAVVQMRKAVKFPDYPARAQAYENLGLVELSIGEAEHAKAAFERALMLNVNQPRANLELATIHFGNGDNVRAVEYYAQFRATARQTPRSLCLGMQLSGALNLANELASYSLALRNLYPGSAEAANCEVPGG
jgi:type IV pilus assembly protein PilF